MKQCIFEQRILIRQSSICLIKIFVFLSEISVSLFSFANTKFVPDHTFRQLPATLGEDSVWACPVPDQDTWTSCLRPVSDLSSPIRAGVRVAGNSLGDCYSWQACPSPDRGCLRIDSPQPSTWGAPAAGGLSQGVGRGLDWSTGWAVGSGTGSAAADAEWFAVGGWWCSAVGWRGSR